MILVTPLNLEANLVEQLPVVPVRNVVTQSDEFVRTPSSSNQVENGKAPVFFRAKTGVDSSTQIESHDQLFHFDSEVKPLLDILVNKTIAQAITELEEEAQLRTLRNQKAFLLNQQIAENKKQKELEQKAIEINKIRQQTIANKQEKLKNLHVFEKKLLAWRMAHQILVPEVVQETKTFLIQKGVFYNPLHVDLKRWLSMDVYGLVDTKLRLQSLTRLLLDGMYFFFFFFSLMYTPTGSYICIYVLIYIYI
jgi:hypothetical protein